MITQARRDQLSGHITRAADANVMELADGAAYAAAVRLAQFARDTAELADWLEMCGLVYAGIPRPKQIRGLVREYETYVRPGAA